MAEEISIKKSEQEYLTEKEARTVKEMFQKYLKSYKEKTPKMNDKEWLEQLFRTELPEMTEAEIKHDSEEIVESATLSFDEVSSFVSSDISDSSSTKLLSSSFGSL